MAESWNGAMAARWESWFKVIFSLLMSVIAFVGVVLWNKVDTLNTSTSTLTVATTALDGSLKMETQARQDLSGRVDDVKTSVQTLSNKIDAQSIGQTAPAADAAAVVLNRKLDKLSTQMYSLQSQLDHDAAEREARHAKGKD